MTLTGYIGSVNFVDEFASAYRLVGPGSGMVFYFRCADVFDVGLYRGR